MYVRACACITSAERWDLAVLEFAYRLFISRLRLYYIIAHTMRRNVIILCDTWRYAVPVLQLTLAYATHPSMCT